MKTKNFILRIFLFLFIILIVPIPVHALETKSSLKGGAKNAEELNEVDYLPYEVDIKNGGWVIKGNTSSGVEAPDTQQKAWTNIFEKYKYFIVACEGVATLTLLLIWIWRTVNLGGAGGNPQKKETSQTGLLLVAISTVLLGSVTIITALFLGLFRG